MPTSDEHIKLAKRNCEFGDEVQTLAPKFKPWTVVAYHYSALHWVDAYLASAHDIHPRNHAARGNWIARDSKLKRDVFPSYQSLQDLSRFARYDLVTLTTGEVNEAKADLELIENSISLIMKKKPDKRAAGKCKKTKGK